MTRLLLDARSRVMMFAPHPDDESLAAGVFLQRAAAVGAAVRVVYATQGERNCWPQRVLERRLWIGERDRCRWGIRRQGEAMAALRTLGIDASEVEFLGLPDQGVTDLLLDGCRATLERLAQTIRQWQPTVLLLPSTADTHPDHSALAVLLCMALDDYLPRQPWLRRVTYLVHGASSSFAKSAEELTQSPLEERIKRRAINHHFTQVALSRRRFLAYAGRPERFVLDEGKRQGVIDGPIQSVQRDREELRLEVAFDFKPLRAEGASLYLLGYDAFGELRRWQTVLPGRSAAINFLDCGTGAVVSVGRYQGDASGGQIVLSPHGFAAHRSMFLKLDRRVWFFDEAGWIEIAPASNLPEVTVEEQLAVA